jgi:glucokinase
MSGRVLAADVGGTKTAVALYAVADGGLQVVREAAYPSARHQSLESVLAEFCQPGDDIAAAAFGIAGPVIDGAVVTTNLPWRVVGTAVSAALGGAPVQLLNDLEATALGATVLPPDQLLTLNRGIERAGHRAVIAAGTGLGQAYLFWDGRRHQPAATEGGHADLAARNDDEIALLRYLQVQFGRASAERVLSGPGLVNVYRFLTDGQGRTPAAAVRARMTNEDPGAVIGEAALAGSCAVCVAAVELFVRIYGAQAGNLALTVMAIGGVYVGGGIVGHLLPRITTGAFMDAFTAKGRYAHLMHEIPVHVILDPRAARLGAAHAARALLG